ncbi:MAG: EscU/YscU/HrcU family type III secretion system export apparatus switch protein [Clostridia bacterium]|nr:EscU/YscU/HrcU family type III secretion system export apparatus switch protein [Clostridia bacterium]
MSQAKSKQAVALKYNYEQDMAPIVIASGYGEVAERIIDIAETEGIPVYRDDSASSVLCMLDVGTQIPRELYETVAVIYAQILSTAAQSKQDTKQPRVKKVNSKY